MNILVDPFELNSHGKIVFPSNCFPDLDFSTFESLEQLDAVIKRDFDSKAPTGTAILERIQNGGYRTKFELMRDMALNLFWANRYKMTMYEVLPTRWADVPRQSSGRLRSRSRHRGRTATPRSSAVRSAFPDLPAQWDEEIESSIFEVLYDVFGHRRNHATELSAVVPTVADLVADPDNQTLRLNRYDPDFPRYSYREIVDCDEKVPDLEALHRWSMVLHNQYPWSRNDAALAKVSELRDDDYVVLFYPRDPQVSLFLSRVRSDYKPVERTATTNPEPVEPARPYPALDVRNDMKVQPRIRRSPPCTASTECTNADLIRNSAYNWSPMSAEEIGRKTGIEARRYTADSLEGLSLRAARAAIEHAGVGPADIGAVFVCTCTSSRLIPSIASYVSGQLGIQQTHCSFDLVAACAGMSYGLAEAVRVLQLVDRPVLLICAEKFSDKIGNVRPSRMIFGDGAAAMVIGPAPEGRCPTSSSSRPTPAVRSARSTRSCGPTPSSRTTSRSTDQGEVARRALPPADDRGHLGCRSRRQGRFAAEQHRIDRSAPGEQDDGDRSGRKPRA